MNQITFCESVGIDGEGFRQRLQGRGIRDCILILTPEGVPSFGLLHKEPSSSTFVEEEIRGNKGALNIDSCRITSSGDHKRPFQPTNSDRDIYGKHVGFQPTNSEGRFPANLVLIHSSECVYSGKKLIKGDPRECGEGKRSSGFVNIGSDKGVGGPNSKVYGNRDGTEEVDNWECVEHCPVGRLDGQSGVLHSRGNVGPTIQGTPYSRLTAPYKRSSYAYETIWKDSGGASRFFKQVTSQEELTSYFNGLTRQGKTK